MSDGFDAAFRDDLAETLAEAWRRLARGAADRRSGFHTVQLASVGADGGPRLRTVVLRAVTPSRRLLRVHTDARAAKAAELAADARVEICGYDAQAKMQIRLRGLASLHAGDAVADAAWAASGQGSRMAYRGAAAPGAALERPEDVDPQTREPLSDLGRENFLAVTVTVARLEWLYLAASGHRRAVYAWSGEAPEAALSARWLAP